MKRIFFIILIGVFGTLAYQRFISPMVGARITTADGETIHRGTVLGYGSVGNKSVIKFQFQNDKRIIYVSPYYHYEKGDVVGMLLIPSPLVEVNGQGLWVYEQVVDD